MEFKNDIPTKEDRDFIVDDGYNHDEDPTYQPKDHSSASDDDKYFVTGKEFKKLTKKAKKLGAESLDYSTRKNNKYVATLSSGKKVHFGSSQYPAYFSRGHSESVRGAINLLLASVINCCINKHYSDNST